MDIKYEQLGIKCTNRTRCYRKQQPKRVSKTTKGEERFYELNIEARDTTIQGWMQPFKFNVHERKKLQQTKEIENCGRNSTFSLLCELIYKERVKGLTFMTILVYFYAFPL